MTTPIIVETSRRLGKGDKTQPPRANGADSAGVARVADPASFSLLIQNTRQVRPAVMAVNLRLWRVRLALA